MIKPAGSPESASSPVPFEALRRVLELERSKGYADTAVIGGLDRFLGNWSTRAAAQGGPVLVKQLQKLHLLNSRYGMLSPEQREEWLAGVVNFLDTQSAGGAKAAPAASPARRRPAPAAVAADVTPESPVTALRGVSANLAERLLKLGVASVRDMLYFFPNRHLDYSRRKYVDELEVGQDETIIANIWQTARVNIGGRPSTEAIVGDEKGNIRIIWFNNPYLVKTLKTNTRIVVSGRVGVFHGRLQFESPEWEVFLEGELVHTGRLVPIYALTQGLRQRQVRKLISDVVEAFADKVPEFIPSSGGWACWTSARRSARPITRMTRRRRRGRAPAWPLTNYLFCSSACRRASGNGGRGTRPVTLPRRRNCLSVSLPPCPIP